MPERKCAIRATKHTRMLTAYRVLNQDTGETGQVVLCDVHEDRSFKEILAAATRLPQSRPTARRGAAAYPYMLRNGPGCRPGHSEDVPPEE